jgi:signal transduction histidine kinase
MNLSDTALRRLACAVFGLGLVGLIAGIAMDTVSKGVQDPVFGLIVFSFPTVGFVVLLRRPRTNLGWLMLSMGIAFALPLQSYANYALTGPQAPLPGGGIALALSGPTWVPFIGISGYLLMLFPDGHLPSPRWRWFSWLCGVGLVALSFVIIFSPGTFDDVGYPNITNPLGIQALGALGGWIFVLVIFAPLTVVGGAVAVIGRLRHATDPVQRQQLRWLAWTAAVIASLYVLAFVPQAVFHSTPGSSWENWLGSIAAMSFMLIPITIGISVLKYRLYEIDVVIRKTVVFAVLGGFIAIVYVALVAGIGVLVGTRSSALASGIAAAVVAIAFQPARRWARRAADRVVYGGRATPYEVLTEFGENLADTYGAEDVLPRLARVLGEGVGAARAQVWLGTGSARRIVATWTAGDERDDGQDDLLEDVRHQGEVLGALSVRMPANDPIDDARARLVTDLAAQAGLVMRNAGLVEDLRESRRRLVAAQDLERRKLERNIHDGAQQQLVALSVKLRLAQTLLGRDPDKAGALLTELLRESNQALDDLRDLARGIYPPLLADKGLAAALEAQATRSTVATTVAADGVGRYPEEIEAAAYFSCLEAMQNVAKYAQAHAVSITLTASDGRLVFRIADDGVGFDPAATGYGTGLLGIADRLAVLDGSLLVDAAPGHGTRLTGSLPVPSEDARVTEPEPTTARSPVVVADPAST